MKAYATKFEQPVKKIDEEYNSVVRQTSVKNYLNSLRVYAYIGDEVDDEMALKKVYKMILNVSLQVPSSHRGDSHRIEFLCRAVIGYDWSHEPLSRVATNGLTFQKLYDEIEPSFQLEKESSIVNMKERDSRST